MDLHYPPIEVPSVFTYTEEQYNDLQKQSDAYMATMIVFVVLFAAAGAAGGYLFFKNR